MKTRVLEHNSQNVKPSSKRGMMEARGGLCFEVDTRQFRGNKKNSVPERRRKKGA